MAGELTKEDLLKALRILSKPQKINWEEVERLYEEAMAQVERHPGRPGRRGDDRHEDYLPLNKWDSTPD